MCGALGNLAHFQGLAITDHRWIAGPTTDVTWSAAAQHEIDFIMRLVRSLEEGTDLPEPTGDYKLIPTCDLHLRH